MKTRWFVFGSLVLALALAGCAGEDGKDGINGKDGANGATGPAGPPGTDICMDCHADNYTLENYLLPIQTWFEASQHNLGDTYLRLGAGCARCHTNEGFQAYLADGSTAAQPSSSRISCFTCHAPHSTQGFGLRKAGATPIDLGGTYDKGASNTCAVCHQARVPSPLIEDVATNITSSRWGPHHSSQGNVLSASGAYVFAGETYTSSQHNSAIASGCVTCHMGGEIASSEDQGGGHSFRVVYEGTSGELVNSKSCLGSTCHDGWTDADAMDDLEEFQSGIADKLAQIKTILMARGWLGENDLLIIPQGGLVLPVDDRGAIFNYLMFLEDRSVGAHNPKYANDVLDATLAYLNAPPSLL